MKRVVLVVLLCAVAPMVEAQSASPRYATTVKAFTTVDSVAIWSSIVLVKGIVEGETTASEWAVTLSAVIDRSEKAVFAANCERLGLLALAKPGQYVLRIFDGGSSGYSYCRLERVAP